MFGSEYLFSWRLLNNLGKMGGVGAFAEHTRSVQSRLHPPNFIEMFKFIFVSYSSTVFYVKVVESAYDWDKKEESQLQTTLF